MIDSVHGGSCEYFELGRCIMIFFKKKNIFSVLILISFLIISVSSMLSAGSGYDNPPMNSKWYFIKSVAAGRKDAGYWDQSGRPYRYKRGTKIKTWAKDKGFKNDQLYQFVNAGGGYVYIRSANRMGYVDVEGGKNGNGTKIQIWDRNRSAAQKFRFKHMGDGKWKIYTYWGRIIATKGKKYSNGTTIHTWNDHNTDTAMWYFEDLRTGKNYEIASGVQGKLIGYNISGGRSTIVDPGRTKVEIWTMDRNDRRNPYKKIGDHYTNGNGIFNFGKKYDEYSSIFLLTKSNDRASTYTALYPKSGRLEIKNFITKKYTDSNYVLVDTKYRGKQYYYKKDGIYYRADSTITRRYSFYFKDVDKINYNNASVKKLVAALGGRKNVKTDADLDKTVRRVFKFIALHTKSSMGRDAKAKEAGNYMFRNCRKTTRSPVDRWPTIQEMAETYAKYGFIPMGSCTANSQVAAALMYAAGVPADRMFVAKFHYDMSWYVEHWVLAFKAKNRWYSIDPQHAKFINSHRMFKNGSLFDSTYFDKERGRYNSLMPFEAWVLPGSPLKDVPYLGNPKDLDKLKK